MQKLLSLPYNSDHKSIIEEALIFWSIRNEPMSKKHSRRLWGKASKLWIEIESIMFPVDGEEFYELKIGCQKGRGKLRESFYID